MFAFHRSFVNSSFDIRVFSESERAMRLLEAYLDLSAAGSRPRDGFPVTVRIRDGDARYQVDSRVGTIESWLPALDAEDGGAGIRRAFTGPLIALLQSHDYHFLHAAVVCRGRSSVVLSGPSGCGKSSLAVLLSRNGFSLLGDDVVFVRDEGEGYRLRALPTRIKFRSPGLRRIVGEDRFAPADEPGLAGPGKVTVLFPEFDRASAPALRAVPAGEGLRRMIGQNLATDTGPGDARATRTSQFTFFGDLSERASFAELHYNDDNLAEVPALVAPLFSWRVVR